MESQQRESQPVSAKLPKLFLEPHQQQQLQPSGSSALPLFVPELTRKVSGMGSCFCMAQWQELELQALIYRYMLAGVAVPTELLQPIKKSLLHSTPYFLHHPLRHYPHYQPALLHSVYWGRADMDPEPGRCRRTDGKKWRCSRNVVAGHKYCERHMHRGRNRSRKQVEVPTPTWAAASIPILDSGSGGGLIASGTLKTTNTITTSSPLAEMANGTGFGLSAPSSPIDLGLFNQSSSVVFKPIENKGIFERRNEVDNRNDGHNLWHFFDDWPRSIQETSNNAETNTSTINSATSISISMPGNSSSSDISLKLSTGNGEEMGSRGSKGLDHS